MRRINRAIAAGALSVPFALGAPAVALAADGEDTAARAVVQAEDQRYEASAENEDDGLLGILSFDDERDGSGEENYGFPESPDDGDANGGEDDGLLGFLGSDDENGGGEDDGLLGFLGSDDENGGGDEEGALL